MTSDRAAACFYDERAAHWRREAEQWRSRERHCSRLRMAFFAIGAGVLLLAQPFAVPPAILYVALGAAVVGFILAAGEQERSGESAKRAARLAAWYRIARARLDRRWKDLPERPFDVPDEHRALASDLDLFGHGSVFHWLDQTTTPSGRETLGRWLLEPADRSELSQRQAMVRTLAGERQLREELYALGSELAGSLADPRAMATWAASPGWYASRRWLAWLALLMTVAAPVALAVALWTWSPVAWWLVAAVAGVNVLICLGWGGSVYDTFNRVSSRHREVDRYRRLFGLLVDAAQRVPELQSLGRRLSGIGSDRQDRSADVLAALRRLDRIMLFASFRHAGLLAIGHALLQPLFLWDFHVCRALDRWKALHGGHVAEWFGVLGEFEALVSLAVVSHDHPEWVFPSIEPSFDRVIASSLGHPLLAEAERVANDVTVGPAGTVLLVTGSNMSGKSTLLRAIGVNVVLAQAGAPVCARKMSLPPLHVATSMRVQDSLEDGVSFYLAELKRLKAIVDLASDASRLAGRKLLYLLDEILQGTNSRERHLAVARVVAHLVAQGAIGAITTHDLDLATAPLLQDAVCAVHFREEFVERNGERRMVFDYRLRDGVATTTNALALLEMVGLGSHAERQSAGDGEAPL